MKTRRTSVASPSKVAKTTPVGRSIVRGLREVLAHPRGEIKLRTRVIYVADEIDIRAIRAKSGLSQAKFAERYGFSPRTVQEWEQGRSQPENAIRAYLTVIDRDPEAVEKALRP